MNAISDDAFLVIAQNNQTLLGTVCAYTDQHCFDHNTTVLEYAACTSAV